MQTQRLLKQSLLPRTRPLSKSDPIIYEIQAKKDPDVMTLNLLQNELLNGNEERLIHQAIADAHITEMILKCCDAWLDQKTAFGRTMGLKYINALGARHRCTSLVKRLINEEGWDQQTSTITPGKIIGGEALRILSQLCAPNHIARKEAVNWAINRPILAYELWLIWPPSDSLLPLIPALQALLLSTPLHENHREVLEELALKAALLHPSELPTICDSLKYININLKQIFILTLEKQLLRTKSLKMIRTCKTILRSTL